MSLRTEMEFYHSYQRKSPLLSNIIGKGEFLIFNLSLVTLLCICVYSFVSFNLLIISSSLYKNSCIYLYIIDLNLSINSEFLFKALGGKKS